MRPTAQDWVRHLQLNAHVEGGWYSESYRSALLLQQAELPAGFTGNRNACTHIYFLLEKEQFSAFHRIHSDELWHFYSGDPLIIYEIDKNETMIEHLLGNDPTKPGFDFADFEMAEREMLSAQYPAHREIIQALARP